MNFQIQWTHIALLSLSEVYKYTYEEFGGRQLNKLTEQIQLATRCLSIFPMSGKREEELEESTGIEYRSIVVISEIKLLYTISDNTVFIEFVKNTRMDDATMLDKLKDSF